jgi:membrane protease YdiL (CAAX protease family)
LEILVAVVVFFVSTLCELIIMVPGMIVMLFTNVDYIKMLSSSEPNALDQVTMMFSSSDGFNILMLFVTAGMILVVLLFCKLIQRRKMNTLGFRKKGLLLEYLTGFGIGFVIFSIAVFICIVTGSLQITGLSGTFAIGVFLAYTVGFMIQGMAEEVLCRGYMQVSIGRRYSMVVAILANSLFFAVLHLGNSGISILAFVNLVLFGVFASVYYIKRDNIWGIGALHSAWNLVQGNVYGIRVSGMVTPCSVFTSEITEGKELINGGAFGLEGGIAVTIVLTVGTIILLCMKGKKTETI